MANRCLDWESIPTVEELESFMNEKIRPLIRGISDIECSISDRINALDEWFENLLILKARLKLDAKKNKIPKGSYPNEDALETRIWDAIDEIERALYDIGGKERRGKEVRN